MASKNEISGAGVAIATAGAILVYAGFKGITPLAALRQVTDGGPTAVKSTGYTPTTGQESGVVGGSGFANGPGLLAEMERIGNGKKYSQLRRTGPDSFDCSGLVWKAGKNLGLWPSGTTAFSTGTFILHTKEFGLADVGAGNGASQTGAAPQTGDIIWWNGHMGVATDSTHFYSALTSRRTPPIGIVTIAAVDKEHGTHHVFRFTGATGVGAGSGGGGGGGSW